jgi:superfamily II DNA or RNA helicase
MSNPPDRLTPFPILLSLAQDLLPSGPHLLEEALAHLLGDKATSTVDIVSYCADLAALRSLGVLCASEQTRLLLIPPNGMGCNDVRRLLDEKCEGLTFKQVDDSKVRELVHLKLIVFTRTDGRQFAVTGSANYTKVGTKLRENANCELSVLFELHSSNRESVFQLFNILWEHGSSEVNPDDFWPKSTDDQQSESTLIFLPFQKEALADLKSEYKKGESGAILSLPTGAGKTLIAAKFLLDSVLEGTNDYVLWIAPHRELLFQAASTFKKLHKFYRFSELTVPNEDDVYDEKSTKGNIEFETLQAVNRDEGRALQSPKVVVIDEAHWGASYSCQMIPRIKRKYPNAFFLGLTGTPFRKEVDELLGLSKLYGKLIHKDFETLKDTKNSEGLNVFAKVIPDQVKTGFEFTFDEQTLAARELTDFPMKEFNDRKRNRKIAKTWDESKHGKTLVFAVDVEHANNLAKAFREEHEDVRIQVIHTNSISKNVPSEIYPESGNIFTDEERRAIHEKFSSGEIQVLISVNIYTMGVDFPSIQTLFMARPTLSPVLYSQMKGRGLRGLAFKGTKEVRVVDFTDSLNIHRELQKIFMTCHSEQGWSARFGKRITEAQKMLKEAGDNHCGPSDAEQKLIGCAGVYRVRPASNGAIAIRDWRWVNDIGKCVKTGRDNNAIKPYHIVEYVLEDSDEKGKPKAWDLKLVESRTRDAA